MAVVEVKQRVQRSEIEKNRCGEEKGMLCKEALKEGGAEWTVCYTGLSPMKLTYVKKYKNTVLYMPILLQV